MLIDLGNGNNRLGGSVLAQTYMQMGNDTPDVDVELLKSFFTTIQKLIKKRLVLAFHDRSDGGLWTTLCEMAFAGHVGVSVDITGLGEDPLQILFNEELGAVIQIENNNKEQVLDILQKNGLDSCSHFIGAINEQDAIVITQSQQSLVNQSRVELQRVWSETTYQMQSLRDNPVCAQQEFDALLDAKDPGLNVHVTYDINEDIVAPFISKGMRPKVAILREQGVNGQIEMAAAFDRAGFSSVDVHMSDIIEGRVSLADFKG